LKAGPTEIEPQHGWLNDQRKKQQKEKGEINRKKKKKG